MRTRFSIHTGDGVQRLALGNAIDALSDDDAEFDLMVGPAIWKPKHHTLASADKGAASLEEQPLLLDAALASGAVDCDFGVKARFRDMGIVVCRRADDL